VDISENFVSLEGELYKSQCYYARKVSECNTLEEKSAQLLFWHCNDELIKLKWKDHERSLSYGTGKENTLEVLQGGYTQQLGIKQHKHGQAKSFSKG
jgi:hypothetical protein